MPFTFEFTFQIYIFFTLNSRCVKKIIYDLPPERGNHPVVRMGTMLLAAIGLYPQYTAIVTVLMVFGLIQVDRPSLRLPMCREMQAPTMRKTRCSCMS